MTRNISKEAAAQRLYKLAAVARVIQRAKSAGCCGRKRSSGKRRKVKRSSLNKEASRDLMRKIACAVAVIQRTRGLQKTAGDTPIYKNPIAIGGVGGGVLGGTLGAILGPKGQKFLSGLAGAGIGAGVGVGAGYGYTKLKKKPKEEESFEATHGGKTKEEWEADQQLIDDIDEARRNGELDTDTGGTKLIGPSMPELSGARNVPLGTYKAPEITGEQARLLGTLPDSISLPDEWLDKFNSLKTVEGRQDLLRGLYKDMAPQDVNKYARDPELFNKEKTMIDLGRYTHNSSGAY